MSVKLTNFDIIIVIILLNIFTYLLIGNRFNLGFSIENGSCWNILVSMFTHKDAYHLLGNMITFTFSSIYVYNREHGFIKSRKLFLATYLVSGLVGSYFQILLYNFLNFQWENEVSEVADKYNIGKVPTGTVVSVFYRVFNYKRIDALKQIYYANHYGAESCIYGLIGVGIVYSAINLKHEYREFKDNLHISLKEPSYRYVMFYIIKYCYEMFSHVTVLLDIFSKFIYTPWNINWLLTITISEKMNQYNSHLGGAIMGIIIGLVLYRNNKSDDEFKDDKLV
jgi:membrane associated rhomboid family serine protease